MYPLPEFEKLMLSDSLHPWHELSCGSCEGVRLLAGDLEEACSVEDNTSLLVCTFHAVSSVSLCVCVCIPRCM